MELFKVSVIKEIDQTFCRSRSNWSKCLPEQDGLVRVSVISGRDWSNFVQEWTGLINTIAGLHDVG